MPSYRTLSRYLDLPEYRIVRSSLDEAKNWITFWIEPRRKNPTFACGVCGRRTRRVHDKLLRVIEDLPWGPRKVWLYVTQHRIKCRFCRKVRTEALLFARPRADMTRRLEDRIALDCQDAPVSAVAQRWDISWDRAKAADKRFLQDWEKAQPKTPVRHLGMDEVASARGHTYQTVTSDLETGRVLDLRPERTEKSAKSALKEALTPEQSQSIEAVCIDMWEPFRIAVEDVLPDAEIVYDKFHVMMHVGRAVDETRRSEFFRHGGAIRAAMRGKRWLLLSRWENLRKEGRIRLTEALSVNRKLFKAYYLKEEIHQLWNYTYPGAALTFWETWKKSLRWQRMPAFARLVRTIEKHLDGILAHCRHRVRFGVVEAINATVKGIIRRARGYRDHAYLRLKVMWATANPATKASL